MELWAIFSATMPFGKTSNGVNKPTGALTTTTATKPPLARLVTLLGRLPHTGRKAVVRHILACSPHRDALLRDLFD